MLIELKKTKEQEIRDAAELAGAKDQFAGAVERGSVADYKLRIRSGSKDNAVEIQKNQEKELQKLNKTTKENTTLLTRMVEAVVGTKTQEVSIR